MKRTLLPILLGIAIALTLFSLAGIVYFYPEGKQFITPIEVAKAIEDEPKAVVESPPIVPAEVKETLPPTGEKILEIPTPTVVERVKEPEKPILPAVEDSLEVVPEVKEEPTQEVLPVVVEVPLEIEEEAPVEEVAPEAELPVDEKEITEAITLPISITPISEPVIEKIIIEEPIEAVEVAPEEPSDKPALSRYYPTVPTLQEAPFYLAAAVEYVRQQRSTLTVAPSVEEEVVVSAVEEVALPVSEEPLLEVVEVETLPAEPILEEVVSLDESEHPLEEELVSAEEIPVAILAVFPEVEEEDEVTYVDPIRYTEIKDELRSTALEEILAHLENPHW